ncbi:MAG: alpha/beta fold hydrolase [Pseudomonadota bacterium]
MAQVVLIHGLGRSTGSMRPLAVRLGAQGFATTRIGYASRRLCFEEALDCVLRQLRDMPSRGPLHLVGHSLGGVLARHAAERAPDLGIERIVGLGSPYDGSQAAARVARLPGGRALFGPVLDEIPGFASLAPRPGWMAIAGVLALPWPGRLFGLEGENDGLVERRSAHGSAPVTHTVAAAHGWLPLSPAVARHVVEHLRAE